jgi:hypothetical protein
VGFITSSTAKEGSKHITARLFLDGSNPSARAVGAHLVFITDTQAFEADVPDFPIDTTPERRTPEISIAFPSPVAIESTFVDAYTVDGGKPIDCPTQISGTATAAWAEKELPRSATTASMPVVQARFRQAIPPLPCGKTRTYARPTHVIQPGYPYGLTKPVTSRVVVYLDSRGTVVKAEVYKSSGFPDADEQAEAAAYASTYSPAQLLCQPVVGVYIFTADFIP